MNTALQDRDFLWNGDVVDVLARPHHLPPLRVLLSPRGDTLAFHSFPLFANMTVIMTTAQGEREVQVTDEVGTCHFKCYPHAHYSLRLQDRSKEDVPFSDLRRELPVSHLKDAVRPVLHRNRQVGEKMPLHELLVPAAMVEELRRRHADILQARREDHLYAIQDSLNGY